MKNIKVTLLCLLISFSAVYARDFIIRESTNQSITVEFLPQPFNIKEKNVNGITYISVRFAGDDIITKPGQPMVSCRTAIVGIPLGSQIDYQLLELISGEKLNGKLLPTPTLPPSEEYLEDQTYYHNTKIFPSNIILLEKPGFIRNQRVICVKLFPVQYFPETNQIQLIKKIVFKINFTNTKVSVNPNNNVRDKYFYRGSILNYQQAKKWQKYPEKKSLKKSNIALSKTRYKIFVKSEGIYKITGKMLSDNGIQISTIDPKTIKIYNNGGRELPRNLYTQRPDSLIENDILVIDNNDGHFDESDYILFYAKSVEGWDYNYLTKTFSHYINHYTYENIFWLTWGNTQNGKRMTSVTLPIDNQSPVQTSFWDHEFLEEDYYNLLDSGIDWYGKSFGSSGDNSENKTFTFNLKGAIPQDSTNIKIKVAGTSGGTHKFQFYMNEKLLQKPLVFSGLSSKYVMITTRLFSQDTVNILSNGRNDLRIQYSLYSNYSQAYLDWIELHFWRNLVSDEDELFFYSPIQSGSHRYQISDFSKDDIYLFDITDFNHVRKFDNLQISSGTVVFTDTVNSNFPKRYLALTPDKFRTPERIQQDVTSDLRASTAGADFIIITHDDFYDQALALKSLRENCDNLKTEVVKISDIYDDFSCGLFDPVAIRDFIKYAYDNWEIQPRYVLLMGSGDFDYRNIDDPIDHNWIPPFQTTEPYEGDSRAWDDFYVCVNGNDDYLDISIGRLPVRNPDQAANVVKKIIDYKNTPLYGNWRNTITIVADDITGEDERFIEREHTIEAENISEDYLPNSFNINKIYLVEYPGVHTASITGTRKPRAQRDIVDAINNGCLVINYIGHGRYDLWAHEVVLMMDQDLQKIDNGQKQAFWVAGTCYFGRFDNPDYESMTEEVILLKDKGAIGVLAAARLVSSGPNTAFNKMFYSKLFPSAYYKVRLGDAVSITKNTRGNTENDQKLILFADPTLHLANPTYKAKIASVTPDTIKALSRLNIFGEIQKDGFLWPEFNGNILLTAFDSKKDRTYIIKEDDVLKYQLPGNTIFRGTATVNQGKFNFRFIVPKDITYGGKNGRLSVYFWNDEGDGSGFRDFLPVGGTETGLFDHEGPQITIRFNEQDFYNEGFTDENPVLNLEITDSLSGINIAGDIGHNIVLTLDGENTNLTDLFNYYNDSHVSGSISYKLGPLDEGSHNIVVKAWDNSNNSSEISADFTVVIHDKLTLHNVMNYPNPFASETKFTFWTNQDCETTIKIYTVSGRLIKKIDHIYAVNGFNHIYWDGHDEDGNQIANGVYLYKIYAKSQNNGKTISTEAIEKLMIMR